MKRKLLIFIFVLSFLTGCNNTDYEEKQNKLTLDTEYISDTSKLYLDSDGTFQLTICDPECKNYHGVNDHTDNELVFYFEEVNENGSWKPYDEIIKAKVTKDNTIKLNDMIFKLENKKVN